jgi:hypothetical protein
MNRVIYTVLLWILIFKYLSKLLKFISKLFLFSESYSITYIYNFLCFDCSRQNGAHRLFILYVVFSKLSPLWGHGYYVSVRCWCYWLHVYYFLQEYDISNFWFSMASCRLFSWVSKTHHIVYEYIFTILPTPNPP